MTGLFTGDLLYRNLPNTGRMCLDVLHKETVTTRGVWARNFTRCRRLDNSCNLTFHDS